MAKKWIGYIGVGSLMCAALGCGILYTRQARLQQTISDKVLRFHVLANSDSEADQNLKLAVRDAVGSFMQEKLTAVELEHTSFPVKNYGSYTFPAGDYEALRIVIGEGNGHNWWCVMYPNMCFSDSMYEVVDKEAGEKLREVLTTEEYEKVLAEGDYQVRMKYFSWLNPYLEKLAEN